MKTEQLTKTSVKKALMAWNNDRPFISVGELAKALHVGRDSARATVAGLGYIKHGHRKDYLVDAVAERLVERSSC